MTAPDTGANSSLTAMMEDPFVSSNSDDLPASRDSHRLPSFDTQLFNLNASSPAQAKRALETRLAETERQLEQASKVGTALVEQQRQLEDHIKILENQKDESEISSELRQKLADLEREYAETERDTARAILAPKRLAGSSDDHLGTPGIDPKSPLNSALFAGQATNSPSKVSVPSRRQRNQPSGRVHDIEFATEISTSLLSQVRQLQSVVAERDETIKSDKLEKSRMELEIEGLQQRVRVLDDSEQRYKDENWSLETQTHELMNSVKEANEREKKLNGTLSAANTEKSSVQREVEELRQANSKLLEEQAYIQKVNDSEIHLLRRNLNAGDLEKAALQKKLEELNSQNQELAKVVAMRIREHESQGNRDLADDNDSDESEQNTPDNSPPPSPNKFTPRHGHLESETLKSSLGHAHRMIQNLKSTIHREKTEKIELKRMLQESRDEIEQRRRETAAPNGTSTKRLKKKDESFRKPARPDLLGAGRKEKSQVEVQEDTDWEDNASQISPTRSTSNVFVKGRPGRASPDEPSDVYQTATEAEDGFETANERATATESEAFQTGVESMADDSSDSADLTETENNVQTTPRQRVSPSLVMSKARDRNSWHSSASTSDDDDDQDSGHPSPSQVYISRPRVKSKRSVLRRIRPSGEAPMASSSRPSSARESIASLAGSFEQEAPSQEGGQSLFAELAELEGGEEEYDDEEAGTSQASTPRMLATSDSRRPSDAVALDFVPRPVMVDSGMMTEPWEPTALASATVIGEAALVGGAAAAAASTVFANAPSTPKKDSIEESRGVPAAEEQQTPKLVSSGTQWTPLKHSAAAEDDHLSNVPTPPKMAWDERVVEIQQVEAGTQAEPELLELAMATITSQETLPTLPKWPEMGISYISGNVTVPVKHEPPVPEFPELNVSSISSQTTEPVRQVVPVPEFPKLNVSSISSQTTEPVRQVVPVPELPEVNVSSISSQFTEPLAAIIPEPEPVIPIEPVREIPELSLSSVFTSYSTEPVQARLPEPEPTPVPVVEEVPIPEVGVSSISSQHTLPIIPELPEPKVIEVPVPVVEERPIPEVGISSVSSQNTEPIVPELPEPTVIEIPVPVPVVEEKPIPEVGMSYVSSQHTQPIVPELPKPQVIEVPVPVVEEKPIPEVGMSYVSSQHTQPIVPELPKPQVIEVPVPVVEEKPIPEVGMSSLSSQHTEPIVPQLPEPVPEPTPAIPQLNISWLDLSVTEPITPKPVEIAPQPLPTITTLRSVETHPINWVPRAIPSMSEFGIQTDPMDEPKAAAGVAVAVFEDSDSSEADRSRASTSTNEQRISTGLALSDISGNALDRQLTSSVSTDQGCQTMLSSAQIDQILIDRESARPVSSADSRQSREVAAVAVTAASPFATPKLRPRPQHQSSAKSSASTTPRRPDTATSQLSSSSIHPPLPSDHREAILAAEKKSVDLAPPVSPSVMGPPLAPASAYRMNSQTAPRTPNEQGTTRAGSSRTVSTQPRMRRGSQSQMSRRSSVSSFASEIEERFNSNPHNGLMPNGPNSDPRMIQAITQTMIGEYLWKYTRKTGSEGMSTTRHRRYFWIHPYTRMLYWSDRDPQSNGKNETRAKSVPIEAVRVVADDNPYPPGLHCRSLEVVSPGRRVRFTASTSQRHDTWYNALSYLLARVENNSEDNDNNVTLDDIDEFNPGFRSGSRQTARMSLSSYNSRTLRQPPKPQRAASAMSMRSTGTPGRASPALSSPGPNSGPHSSLQVPEERQRSSSRLSNIFNGSIRSMKGRSGQSSSVHDGSVRGQESIEDFGHTHTADEHDRLENVRACCDGKHDVGSLSRTSRYSPRVDRIHSHH
ncbi:Anucleate primary sterigmata protein A [Penicillium malachiteum]|uniref:Anucleate primary sterigmata protein A n=1 Tax=Penicillium malachiteum TaxID=1324776 RepID=UPI002548012F|nr:Anucleate primary sterigmata protein A [Penicillium malachiteum]KAJ5737592.1 Anucleate primary sterigmata protein A [Penicillium malachiteum]